MSASGTKNKRSELALAALASGDEEQVIEALTRIGTHGDAKAIPPLLHAWIAHPTGDVRDHITRLLHQVKATDSLKAFLAALDDEAMLPARDLILSSIWSAGLDARDHLDRIVDLAITGSDTTLFECLTIVENQEIWPEQAVRQNRKRLAKELNGKASPYREALLRSMHDALAERLGSVTN
jgi:hypothetical protein